MSEAKVVTKGKADKDRENLALAKKSSNWRRAISLKPYGDELLTNSANQWIFVARNIVFLMATAEALSWGYWGSLFFSDWRMYLTAMIAGGFVFLAVWAADVTLLTLDRGKAYYDKEIFGADDVTTSIETLKTVLAAGFRVAVIGGSLYITAPFLNQIIFNADIKSAIERETTQAINGKRAEISKKHDDAILMIEAQLDGLEKQRTEEIQGRVGSGKPGRGKAAESIDESVLRKREDLKKAKAEREGELGAFDMVAGLHDYRELGYRWGVTLPQNSIAKRGEVIKPILEAEDARRTELAIRAFLGLLFIILLILKFFEPRGVKIYLSEALHQAWMHYKAGVYDRWVRVDERWDRAQMPPYRFEEFMIHTYSVRRKADELEKRDTKLNKVMEDVQDIVMKLQSEKAEEEKRLQPELNEMKDESRRLEAEVIELRKLQKSRQQLLEFKLENITELSSELSGIQLLITQPKQRNGYSSFSTRTVLDGHVDSEFSIKSQIQERRNEYAELEKDLVNIKEKVESLSAQKAALDLKIKEKEVPVQEIEDKIAEIRRTARAAYVKYADKIADRLNDPDFQYFPLESEG